MLGKHARYVVLTSVLLSSTSIFAGTMDFDYGTNAYHLHANVDKAIVFDDGQHYYARDGRSFFLYSGYVYNINFLTTTTRDGFNPVATPSQITYSGKSILPDSFNSIEVGFGRQWGKHVDVRFAYIQQFEETKNGTVTPFGGVATAAKGTVSMKGVYLGMDFIFNPNDQFQMGTILGATIADRDIEIIYNNSTFQVEDTTEINPTAGVELLCYLTKSFALRFSGQYTLSAYTKVSSGEMNIFGGLSYNLPHFD